MKGGRRTGWSKLLGKSIRDKNREGGNCRSVKPNLHRWPLKMQNHEDQFEEKKVLGEWTSKLKDRQFSPELIQGSKFIRGGIHRGAEVKFSCFNLKLGCGQWLWNWDACSLTWLPLSKVWLRSSHGMTRAFNTLIVAMCMWMDCTDVATLILRNEGPGPGVEAQGTAAKIWIQDGEVSAGLEDAVWACRLVHWRWRWQASQLFLWLMRKNVMKSL